MAKAHLNNWLEQHVDHEDILDVKKNPDAMYYSLRKAMGNDEPPLFKFCINSNHTIDLLLRLQKVSKKDLGDKRDIYFTLFSDKDSSSDYDETRLIAQLILRGVLKTDGTVLFFVYATTQPTTPLFTDSQAEIEPDSFLEKKENLETIKKNLGKKYKLSESESDD